MQIPFFEKVADSRVVLLAGAGGGFDIASGIPIYLHLRRQGKQVILANLSFTKLRFTDSEEIYPGTFRVTSESRDVPYFPEKFIVEWLEKRGETPYMYGFSNELGARTLGNAYAEIIKRHEVDTLVLVDGGTDSLMFGDEVGVATIIEDACSIVAAAEVGLERSFLAAIGFGVERHHNLDHHACLENIATLTKDGAYLGAVSLTKDMPDGRDYLDLVSYMNERLPTHMSIVSNSIVSAMQGEFGDFHTTPRTRNSEQFINPFMGLFWFFTLQGISSRLVFADKIKESDTMNDVVKAFQLYRAMNVRRPSGKIPL